MENKEQIKGAIVINRMYVGNYLSTNLGHEVINMFQADNDNHYLYLNARGNFNKRGKEVGTMLLVRGIGEGRVEVVGMAKNLKLVDGACCTLPRDLGKTDYRVRKAQEDALNNVTYKGVSIFDIFGKEGQQSVYASYWVNKGEFFVPKEGKRLIIAFSNSSKGEKKSKEGEEHCTLRNHNFASTSLHQFILEGDDLYCLQKLCNNETLWDVSDKKPEVNNNIVEERKISLFDICQIQNDENRFSNAISYFIQKYPDLWQRLLRDIADIKYLDEIESVTREENAKVDSGEYEDMTGGRIDLLIRTKKYHIIIENKIDSGIIEDENGVTQLSRYYHYVKYLKKEQIESLEKQHKSIVNELGELCEKLNNPHNTKSKYRDGWGNKIKIYNQQLDCVNNQIEEVENRNIVGLVLTPKYNKPKEALLIVKDLTAKIEEQPEQPEQFKYKVITYEDVYSWLGEHAKDKLKSDINFMAFYDAMKRHTYSHESESMYQEMLEKFARRIKEVKKQPKYKTPVL